MRVIQKRADELKEGDRVVAIPRGEETGTVHSVRHLLGTMRVSVWAGALWSMQSNRLCLVEAHDELTPAQQHADELVRLLRVAQSVEGFRMPPDDLTAMRQVLDKIAPPQPPTLEEALAALAAIRASGASGMGIINTRTADDVLERARASGVLK